MADKISAGVSEDGKFLVLKVPVKILFEYIEPNRPQFLPDGALAMKSLTRRQQEVLDGIRNGLGNKEIASNLRLSERTVKFHVSVLFQKLKLTDRRELLMKFGYRDLFKPTQGLTTHVA